MYDSYAQSLEPRTFDMGDSGIGPRIEPRGLILRRALRHRPDQDSRTFARKEVPAVRGQGRVCTPAKLASVQPAAHQSFYSLCAAYLPCSGLCPETPTSREMSVTMSTSEQRQRTGRLPAIRCFDSEEAAVRQKASDCGMSVGQFMLSAALGRGTRTKIDTHILNELRRLGSLQKHLASVQ
ncbi:MAG: hypothetical protein CBARDMAM_3939 [uncultured Caballeronia sp.]|nr:MAG: hypothetical protein CBARDMAM_3939 [uncultured Caballeronia sp.]